MLLPALGWLIASRRPRNAYGWLMLASALCFGIGGLSVGYLLYAARSGSGADGLGLAVAGASLFSVHYGLIWIFIPLLFPDGRLPSPRWRPIAWAGGACIAVHAVAVVLVPGNLDQDVPLPNPLARPGAAGTAALVAASATTLLTPVIAVGALGGLLVRWRGASPAERRQLRWMVAGVLVNLSGFVLILGIDGGHLPAYLDWLAVLSALGAVPAAVGVALVRYRLLDIRVVVRKSLAYGLLWSAIALVYAGVAMALGVAAGERLPVTVAVALAVGVTLVFQPVRNWLEALAERLVFGVRPTAAELLAETSTTLNSMTESSSQLQHLAHVARSALATTWVAVELADGTRAVADTVTGPPALTVPITSDGKVTGHLSCGPKIDGRITDRDRSLLVALAAQAGLALRSARLGPPGPRPGDRTQAHRAQHPRRRPTTTRRADRRTRTRPRRRAPARDHGAPARAGTRHPRRPTGVGRGDPPDRPGPGWRRRGGGGVVRPAAPRRHGHGDGRRRAAGAAVLRRRRGRGILHHR
jgi:hypothetical protein